MIKQADNRVFLISLVVDNLTSSSDRALSSTSSALSQFVFHAATGGT